MKKNNNIAVGLFFILAFACGQRVDTKKELFIDEKSMPIIETFFENLQNISAKKAIDDLLGGNENISLSDSLTVALRDKIDYINEASGIFVSKRLMRKKALENDLVVYAYIVKYEKKFYRFTFVFYNNDKDVKLFRFGFDEAMDVELEESIKLYVN